MDSVNVVVIAMLTNVKWTFFLRKRQCRKSLGCERWRGLKMSIGVLLKHFQRHWKLGGGGGKEGYENDEDGGQRTTIKRRRGGEYLRVIYNIDFLSLSLSFVLLHRLRVLRLDWIFCFVVFHWREEGKEEIKETEGNCGVGEGKNEVWDDWRK